jgi:hypothetical protein
MQRRSDPTSLVEGGGSLLLYKEQATIEGPVGVRAAKWTGGGPLWSPEGGGHNSTRSSPLLIIPNTLLSSRICLSLRLSIILNHLSRHPKPYSCHLELFSCHSALYPCHPKPFPCHPERERRISARAVYAQNVNHTFNSNLLQVICTCMQLRIKHTARASGLYSPRMVPR